MGCRNNLRLDESPVLNLRDMIMQIKKVAVLAAIAATLAVAGCAKKEEAAVEAPAAEEAAAVEAPAEEAAAVEAAPAEEAAAEAAPSEEAPAAE